MYQPTYVKGDLVHIPADVYLFQQRSEPDGVHISIPLKKTKKPQVGIFMGWERTKKGKSFARVMCCDTTWLVDAPNINWMENQC